MQHMILQLISSRATLWIRFGSATPAGTSKQGGRAGRKGREREREREKKTSLTMLSLNAKCYENCTVLDNGIIDKQCN